MALFLVLGLVLASCGSGDSDADGLTAPVETSGPLVAYTQTPLHTPSVGQPIAYPFFPPNQGNHWPAWAQCGLYDVEINDEFLVHNLEHGHVIISYNLPDPADVERMRSLAQDLRNLERYGVVRPYSKIEEGTVAMTAWGLSERVQGVDEAEIQAFYLANRANTYSQETSRRGSAISC